MSKDGGWVEGWCFGCFVVECWVDVCFWIVWIGLIIRCGWIYEVVVVRYRCDVCGDFVVG